MLPENSAGAERVYAVQYDQLGSSRHNPDFRGKGTLTVTGSPPTYVFCGPARGTMFGGESIELALTPDEIWNVLVERERVQFSTRGGVAGREGKPFVFFCRSFIEAEEIARALPGTKDAEGVAGEQFFEQVRRLPMPTTKLGWITNLIIGANIAAFVAMGLAGAGWIDVADITPYYRFGANRADLTTDGEWWRLVTCMFLHFGVVHLLLNMWALLQAGHLVERLYGRTLYTVLYFGGGIIASVASLFWHREKFVLSAGASGAVFAVYGGLLGYMLRERQTLPKIVFQPLLKSTGLFAAYNILYGLARPNIDNAAHLGGLIGGLGLGWLLALPMDLDRRVQMIPRRLRLGLAAIAAVVVATVAFAPRYDYHVMDLLARQRVNTGPTAKEPELLQQQQKALAAYASNHDGAALAQWIEREALPFYSRWHDALRALQMEPARSSTRRRDELVTILQMKIDAYERLRTGAKRGDPEALRTFRADERKVADALKANGNPAK